VRRPIVLVADELPEAGLARLGSDCEIRHVVGADRPGLLSALADVDALIVRSTTQVDDEAIRSAPNLRVVARAGVGLDNIDVEAATRAGVMVINAPTSNIVTTAEQTITVMLACARNTPQAPRGPQARRVEEIRIHRCRA
jgi:D-3-phosphoglycerate dehydrogenase / 2-oxoglutarate reductase